MEFEKVIRTKLLINKSLVYNKNRYLKIFGIPGLIHFFENSGSRYILGHGIPGLRGSGFPGLISITRIHFPTG